MLLETKPLSQIAVRILECEFGFTVNVDSLSVIRVFGLVAREPGSPCEVRVVHRNAPPSLYTLTVLTKSIAGYRGLRRQDGSCRFVPT
jgi:hypothetical protein